MQTLQLGSKGGAVITLQNALNEAFQQSRVATDGVFGAGTKAAVIDFQKSVGLPADGIVGPATWTKLAPYMGGVSISPTSPSTSPSAPPSTSPGAPVASGGMSTGVKIGLGAAAGLVLFYMFG